ncbi:MULTISPECIES: AAA family ATPase [unclassified Pseudomonas]|uniref:AAA family ATPase n=1 Tax=unclassified Pseudomonas TaxID=196821 RepID=UPI001B3390C2|nr:MULTISPECIES: AAA family ATPase [unclassified Pseudomonas]MBP5944004.1 AAA family ATPase [Pseudomonas sp. P9(2020)]MBZ9562967.1 AAA family ATPase [Pseudomonas sp. P116]
MNDLFIQQIRLKSDRVAAHFLRGLFPLQFNNRITVFIGENGSGKSTLLEALAIKLGCNPEGGGKNFNFSTENTHSKLHETLMLSKGYRREKDVFFYRAETFYNLNTAIRKLDAEGSFDPEIKTYYGGVDMHCMSHGEAMEALFQNRFKAQGLYVLDEPEASLSPLRQLVFINRVMELSRKGSQFIIATHSPLIMSIPGCDLRQISQGRSEPITPADTDAYAVYKAVLHSAGAYIAKNMQ